MPLSKIKTASIASSVSLTTPALGTPSSGVATNLTGLPLTTGVTGTLPTANGGTNLTSFTSGGVVYASSASALATGSALTFDGAILGVNGVSVGRGAGAVATNTAMGYNALYSNTTGNTNTASGYAALYSNTTGYGNTASGYTALYSNTTGYNNTASGQAALQYNTTGYGNTASGFQALYSNTTGSYNTASGFQAFYSNTTGNYNTASGFQALYSNTTGGSNTASGYTALYYNTTGSGNTAISPLNSASMYTPVFNPTTENNRFCMGSTGVTNAYVQVAWTVVSDARDKTDFAPVPHGLAFVTQLQPTAYRYKMQREDTVGHGPVRYGFKAQEVLALEGDAPVIVDAEDSEKLRFNDQSMIAVLVNAVKELKAEFDLYKSTHP